MDFIKNSNNQNDQINRTEDLYNSIINDLQIKELKQDFEMFTEKMCKIDDTFKFWHEFVHKHCFSYVALYLSFRSSNWYLRIAALKNLAPLFHAFDRHMYLRLIPKHLNDVLTMPIEVLQHLENGGFSATKSGKSWQQLALDEAHESFINLDVKQSVQKPSPDLLDTMSVYLPYRASLQNNVQVQLGKKKDEKDKKKRIFKSYSKT